MGNHDLHCYRIGHFDFALSVSHTYIMFENRVKIVFFEQNKDKETLILFQLRQVWIFRVDV